jgi:putative transposase
MSRFRRMKTLQKFASVLASAHNLFNQERHLVSRAIFKERRSEAFSEWRSVMDQGQVGFGRQCVLPGTNCR